MFGKILDYIPYLLPETFDFITGSLKEMHFFSRPFNEIKFNICTCLTKFVILWTDLEIGGIFKSFSGRILVFPRSINIIHDYFPYLSDGIDDILTLSSFEIIDFISAIFRRDSNYIPQSFTENKDGEIYHFITRFLDEIRDFLRDHFTKLAITSALFRLIMRFYYGVSERNLPFFAIIKRIWLFWRNLIISLETTFVESGDFFFVIVHRNA